MSVVAAREDDIEQPSLLVVIQRLERVERENCRWKAMVLLALLTLSSFVLMGQTRTPRDVMAESFTLVNAQGEVVGAFRSAGNLPGLLMYAPGDQGPAICIDLAEANVFNPPPARRVIAPRMWMSATSPGRTGVHLDIDPSDNAPAITMLENVGHGRLQLYLIGGNDPLIQLRDDQMNASWEARP